MLRRASLNQSLAACPMNEQKKPNPVDIHIGSRLKRRRDEQGMSQDTLGAHLGISFQQIQKYEKGTNRLAASRLFEIAEILKTPLAYFFDGLPKGGASQGGFAESDAAGYEPGFLSTPEGKNLIPSALIGDSFLGFPNRL